MWWRTSRPKAANHRIPGPHVASGPGRYHEKARRKVLFAPTYHDVTQAVYKRAVGRWERYAEALAPIQPQLEPYLKAFGYSA